MGTMPEGALVAVTVIGEDRPRIVATVSRVLFDAGCNLEDVSSTILRGHFSMVLIVRVPAGSNADELQNRFDALASDLNLVISVRPVAEAPHHVAPPTHMVSVYGADRPGIVYRITDRLAAAGVNITDLTSRVIGPDEAPVYALMLEVAAPGAEDLQASLSEVAAELAIDVTVRNLEPDIL